MICSSAHFTVSDNSGAKIVKLIKVPGQNKFKVGLGTKVRVSVVSAEPQSNIKKGTKHLAIVSALRMPCTRKDGSVISFSENSVIIMNNECKDMVGTRVLGAIAHEIRIKYPSIASKAKEIY
jgi:large subunit ribosomal protein L14